MRGVYGGVPNTIRGLHWGSSIYGNYHTRPFACGVGISRILMLSTAPHVLSGVHARLPED